MIWGRAFGCVGSAGKRGERRRICGWFLGSGKEKTKKMQKKKQQQQGKKEEKRSSSNE